MRMRDAQINSVTKDFNNVCAVVQQGMETLSVSYKKDNTPSLFEQPVLCLSYLLRSRFHLFYRCT